MNQGIETTSTAEVRRAFERLQAAFEELGDRHRELRREKRQMHEYIIELEREVGRAEQTATQKAQDVESSQVHLEELRERLEHSERRNRDLINRIGELEQAVAERESLVAEQEDALQQYHARFDDAREFATRQEKLREEMEAKLADAERAAENAGLERERSRARMTDLEAALTNRSEAAAREVESLSQQLTELRGVVSALEAERAELLATQGTAGAGTDQVREAQSLVAALTERLAGAEGERDEARAEAGSLRRRVQELETSAAAPDDAAAKAALEAELRRSRAALAEKETVASSARNQVESLRNQLTLFEQQVGELRAERERLLATTGNGVLTTEERDSMVAEIQTAIGIIDGYLSEA